VKNELEKLAEDLDRRAERHREVIHEYHAGKTVVSHRDYDLNGGMKKAYEDAIRELRDLINPCRILYEAGLTTDKWDQRAGWITVEASGAVIEQAKRPRPSGAHFINGAPIRVAAMMDIPLGIDWRTLKVSREQMEAYEREREEG
jgi:hypothetical protein